MLFLTVNVRLLQFWNTLVVVLLVQQKPEYQWNAERNEINQKMKDIYIYIYLMLRCEKREKFKI